MTGKGPLRSLSLQVEAAPTLASRIILSQPSFSIFTSTACARDSDGDCVSPCPASDGVRPGLDVLVPYILRGGVPKGRRATSSERHTPN